MARKEPFAIKVGTVTFDEPYEDSYSYEVAAWHTKYALTPGTYDVYANYERDQLYPQKMRLSLYTNDIPGVILSENTQSLWGGVPIGNKPPSKEGQPMSEKIGIKSHDITTGKIKLDLDVPFITLAKNEKGHTVIEHDTDHPEWVTLMKARDRHKFLEDLKPPSRSSTDYYTLAEKSGFFEDEVVDKGIEMGRYYFEYVIRLDNRMRSKLGYGVMDAGISLEETAGRFKGKSGDIEKIFNSVMNELIEAHNLPVPDRQNSRPDAPSL